MRAGHRIECRLDVRQRDQFGRNTGFRETPLDVIGPASRSRQTLAKPVRLPKLETDPPRGIGERAIVGVGAPQLEDAAFLGG
jgi:hypothetical protein